MVVGNIKGIWGVSQNQRVPLPGGGSGELSK